MRRRAFFVALALVATEAGAAEPRTPGAGGVTCPTVTPVASRWLVTASTPTPEPIVKMPAVPASLERRVGVWQRIWGELDSGQFLLVDNRRPFIVHAEVDCRGRVPACDDMRARALEQASARLRTRTNRDGLYGRDKALAANARQHMLFLEGRRDGLAHALAKGAQVLGAAEAMFTLIRVPHMYARLAVVESMMRGDARSSKGALGAYQFMPRTASRYLMVREGVDERLDPVRASLAAAKYLKRLKGELGSWPKALTAYNTGASRVRAAMRQHRTRDIGKAIDGGTHDGFGFASQNYYAQVAALARVTSDLQMARPLSADVVVRVDKRVQLAELARCIDVDRAVLVAANPSLTRAIVDGAMPVPKGYLARVYRPPVPARVD
jgi:membrane-bound lytic murein transglycosylase D